MDATEVPLKAPSVPTDVPTSDVEQIERALIDASTRVPVLMFYTSAILWLLAGTVLAMLTSFKMHMPDLLGGVSFLTWGRLRPAHMNSMVYGWAANVGIGTAIGLVLALISTRALSALLYGVGAFDLATFVLVTFVLAAIALLASYIPALRASRADPMIALGHTG